MIGIIILLVAGLIAGSIVGLAWIRRSILGATAGIVVIIAACILIGMGMINRIGPAGALAFGVAVGNIFTQGLIKTRLSRHKR
ncbi:MAG: hypothetical protein FWF43_08185 [Propionibacteriaceae bacterium]|nr:hypothetical protein [Propionibacteriaceae bacterium]